MHKKTFSTLLERCRFKHVHIDVTEANFPSVQRKVTSLKLIKFKISRYRDEILNEIGTMGLKPGQPLEFFEWLSLHPRTGFSYPIACLCPVWDDGVLSVWDDKICRELSIDDASEIFHSDYRFFVVRTA